jgi:electron transfer flavoprotein beta subunit
VQIRVKADGSGVETDNVKMSMNPPDENAVEEALRIKESGKADEVVVVSIGEDKAQETIRTALAMGADRGIHVKTSQVIEPLAVAKILEKLVQKENPKIILMGKQAIDDDSNQTGQMLSAKLGWAQGTFASKIELQDESVIITREIDEGLEKIKTSLPVVATCDLRLNEPRYASLPNIMKAKKKPIDNYTSEDLDVDVSSRIKQLKVEEPSKRTKGIMVADASELVQKLKHEAKVI